MSPLVIGELAILLLALFVIAWLWGPAPKTHLQDQEAADIAGQPPNIQRRLERLIERRAGRGATTTGQLLLVLFATFGIAAALFFPFFKISAVIPAFVLTIIVSQIYLQMMEAKRTNKLEEQTQDMLMLIVASLRASSIVSTQKTIGELLFKTELPLQEEVVSIVRPLQVGQPFLPALEDVMNETRSNRLRRFLHLWRASEEESLGTTGQAARFLALYQEESKMEEHRRKARITAKRAQSQLYIVMAIIPALVAVLMVMVPQFRQFYMDEAAGHVVLAILLLFELMAFIISQRIVKAALQ